MLLNVRLQGMECKVYQPAWVPVRADKPAIVLPWLHAMESQNHLRVYGSGRTLRSMRNGLSLGLVGFDGADSALVR